MSNLREISAQCRQAIQELNREIEHKYSQIRDIAHKHIPDFHFLDYEVSTFWTCETSPIGMCVFTLDDYGRKTDCRYCHNPVERK